MTINSTQLLDAYEQTRQLLATEAEAAAISSFAELETDFEQKKLNPDASIMVYGVYNAGKSTLINALLGREEAKMDDIPTTDEVDSYPWGKYSILDTPGVDAPIEHEKVTREQMLQADAVIFVVDPLGTIEEEKTLSVLVDLLEKRKQVFMVFNDKKGLSDENFIKLKEQTRKQIQQIAAERGLHDILKDIPIARINAKRALNGQLNGKPALVEQSGYPAFKDQLIEFLDSISPNDVYDRLHHRLSVFLDKQVDAVKGLQSDENEIKRFDAFIEKMISEKSDLSERMKREIKKGRQEIKDKIKRAFRMNPQGCEEHIKSILSDSAEEIQDHLQKSLEETWQMLQKEINELEAIMPALHQYQPTISMPHSTQDHPDEPVSMLSTPAASVSSDATSQLITSAAQKMTAVVKPEHVVDTLKTVKTMLPSLMSGIGIKTMEKWANTFITKFIPYIGPAVSTIFALKDLLAGDSEEKALREHMERKNQERERFEQQIEDFSIEVADAFKKTMHDNLLQVIDDFFSQVESQVINMRNGFSEKEKSLSERLQRWRKIQQLAKNARQQAST